MEPELRARLEQLGVTFDEYGHATYEGETTDPYKDITWSVGNGDDFHCFDYLILPGGYLAVHSVINSETASFIQDGTYEICLLAEWERAVENLIDIAFSWAYDNGVFAEREKDGEDDEEGTPAEQEAESQASVQKFREAVKQAVQRALEALKGT